MKPMKCFDCKDLIINEYYMVHNELWTKARMEHGWNKGLLCIGCLEIRLGRFLTKDDFTDCPYNKMILNKEQKASNRLWDRMNKTGGLNLFS